MVRDVKIIYSVVEDQTYLSLSDSLTIFTGIRTFILIPLRLGLFSYLLMSSPSHAIAGRVLHFHDGSCMPPVLEISSHL
jgi:hypothetical protein